MVFFGHTGSSYEVSEECLSSLSAALKTLAREVTNRVPNPQASQIRLVSLVPRLLSVIANKIAYPVSCTHGRVEDCEDDATLMPTEILCAPLFTNATRSCPQLVATFVMERVKSLFLVDHPRRLQSASMEEIEATLLLVLQVRAPASTFTSGPEFMAIVHGIHRSGISAHPHAAVLLQYFDMTVKYHACLASSPQSSGLSFRL